jgi:hypothetical protein
VVHASLDGQWLPITSESYLLLIKNAPTTREKSLQLQAYRLSITPVHVRQFKDDVGQYASSKSCLCLEWFGLYIIEIMGSFMITWHMKKVLAGHFKLEIERGSEFELRILTLFLVSFSLQNFATQNSTRLPLGSFSEWLPWILPPSVARGRPRVVEDL